MLSALIAQCMARDPAERPSMTVFREALIAIVSEPAEIPVVRGLPLSAPRPHLLRPVSRRASVARPTGRAPMHEPRFLVPSPSVALRPGEASHRALTPPSRIEDDDPPTLTLKRRSPWSGTLAFLAAGTLGCAAGIASMFAVWGSEPGAEPSRPEVARAAPIATDPAVHIESAPAGAEIVDVASGQVLGIAPASISLPREGNRRVQIRLDGYAPRQIDLRAGRSRVLVTLIKPGAMDGARRAALSVAARSGRLTGEHQWLNEPPFSETSRPSASARGSTSRRVR
jgi:hypothetical protein